MIRSAISGGYRLARRIVITIVGVAVLLAGVAMLVLPGPAFVVIPLGLAILSLEFAWARGWLATLRRKLSEAAHRRTGRDYDRDTRPDR